MGRRGRGGVSEEVVPAETPGPEVRPEASNTPTRSCDHADSSGAAGLSAGSNTTPSMHQPSEASQQPPDYVLVTPMNPDADNCDSSSGSTGAGPPTQSRPATYATAADPVATAKGMEKQSSTGPTIALAASHILTTGRPQGAGSTGGAVVRSEGSSEVGSPKSSSTAWSPHSSLLSERTHTSCSSHLSPLPGSSGSSRSAAPGGSCSQASSLALSDTGSCSHHARCAPADCPGPSGPYLMTPGSYAPPPCHSPAYGPGYAPAYHYAVAWHPPYPFPWMPPYGCRPPLGPAPAAGFCSPPPPAGPQPQRASSSSSPTHQPATAAAAKGASPLPGMPLYNPGQPDSLLPGHAAMACLQQPPPPPYPSPAHRSLQAGWGPGNGPVPPPPPPQTRGSSSSSSSRGCQRCGSPHLGEPSSSSRAGRSTPPPAAAAAGGSQSPPRGSSSQPPAAGFGSPRSSTPEPQPAGQQQPAAERPPAWVPTPGVPAAAAAAAVAAAAVAVVNLPAPKPPPPEYVAAQAAAVVQQQAFVQSPGPLRPGDGLGSLPPPALRHHDPQASGSGTAGSRAGSPLPLQAAGAAKQQQQRDGHVHPDREEETGGLLVEALQELLLDKAQLKRNLQQRDTVLQELSARIELLELQLAASQPPDTIDQGSEEEGSASEAAELGYQGGPTTAAAGEAPLLGVVDLEQEATGVHQAAAV